jgi:hypothetical protein
VLGLTAAATLLTTLIGLAPAIPATGNDPIRSIMGGVADRIRRWSAHDLS